MQPSFIEIVICTFPMPKSSFILDYCFFISKVEEAILLHGNWYMISDTRCLYLGLLSSYIIFNAGAWMAKWSGSLKLELATNMTHEVLKS